MTRRRSTSRLALELKRSRLALVLYALIVILGLSGYAVIFRNQDVQWVWSDTAEFKVALDHAKGVRPGLQEVRIAGVPVGEIKAVERDGRDATLTLSIDAEYWPVYRDARIRVRPVTPLEDQYVDIVDRGTPEAGELPEGGEVPKAAATTPVDIGRVLDIFDSPTRQRMASLLASFEQGLGKESGERLRWAFQRLAPFLDEFRKLSQVLADHRQATRRLVHNASRLTKALGERDRALERLVREGSAALGELAAAAAPLDRTLAEVPPTLAALRESLRELSGLADRLDPALAALDPVVDRLPGALTAARRLAGAGTPAATALQPALERLAPVLAELEPVLRDLEPGLRRIAEQAPAYDRVSRTAAGCTLAIGKFFQWTASVLKYFDAWGTYPRGELVVGSHVVRGQTPDPFIRPNEGCTHKGGGK